MTATFFKMKTVFRSHEFSSYTSHYSSLLKRSDYPEEKAIYSTKHQKQKKRSSFEGSDQTSCQPSLQAKAPGKHPTTSGEGSPPGPPMPQAPHKEPANLPAVLCSFTAVVVGTVGRGWVFRFGGIIADHSLRLYCLLFLNPSMSSGKAHFFSRWKGQRGKHDLLELKFGVRSRTDLVK